MVNADPALSLISWSSSDSAGTVATLLHVVPPSHTLPPPSLGIVHHVFVLDDTPWCGALSTPPGAVSPPPPPPPPPAHPFYEDATSKASRVQAAKLDLSKASSALVSALEASGILQHPLPARIPSSRLRRLARVCGIDLPVDAGTGVPAGV